MTKIENDYEEEQYVYSVGWVKYECEDCKRHATFGYINYIQVVTRCPYCGGDAVIIENS